MWRELNQSDLFQHTYNLMPALETLELGFRLLSVPHLVNPSYNLAIILVFIRFFSIYFKWLNIYAFFYFKIAHNLNTPFLLQLYTAPSLKWTCPHQESLLMLLPLLLPFPWLNRSSLFHQTRCLSSLLVSWVQSLYNPLQNEKIGRLFELIFYCFMLRYFMLTYVALKDI